jgi:hypothetical protein
MPETQLGTACTFWSFGQTAGYTNPYHQRGTLLVRVLQGLPNDPNNAHDCPRCHGEGEVTVMMLARPYLLADIEHGDANLKKVPCYYCRGRTRVSTQMFHAYSDRERVMCEEREKAEATKK